MFLALPSIVGLKGFGRVTPLLQQVVPRAVEPRSAERGRHRLCLFQVPAAAGSSRGALPLAQTLPSGYCLAKVRVCNTFVECVLNPCSLFFPLST